MRTGKGDCGLLGFGDYSSRLIIRSRSSLHALRWSDLIAAGPKTPRRWHTASPGEEPDRSINALSAAEIRADPVVCALAIAMRTDHFRVRHTPSACEQHHVTVRSVREYLNGGKRTTGRAEFVLGVLSGGRNHSARHRQASPRD